MASTLVTLPDFNYSGQFYPEILADLEAFKRRYIQELSEQNPAASENQLLRAFALVGHVLHSNLDHVARERFITTARLRESVKAHLALMGYPLAQGAPAQVEMLAKLAKVFDTTVNLIPVSSLFATQTTTEQTSIVFEALTDYATARTDIATVLAYDTSAATYTTPALPVAIWGNPIQPGDLLYVGHPDIQFDQIDFTIGTAATNVVAGVWEYYDGDYEDAIPDSAEDVGATIKLVLNGWLGEINRANGIVRVRSNRTGAYEDVVVQWDGSDNFVETSGNLGQGTISEEANDYTVGSLWQELEIVTDGTDNLTETGVKVLTFVLPQSVVRRWTKAAIGTVGAETSAYWIRFRVIAITGTPTAPVIDVIDIAQGNQWLPFEATQGQTREDAPLGSSSGLPGQSFQLRNYPVIDSDLVCRVNEGSGMEEWTRVPNMLNSLDQDRHFYVTFDDAGRCTYHFGDGVNGKVPAAGTDNIEAGYRTMEDINGNVGPLTVIVNRAGIAHFDALYNPRSATGWTPADGYTPEDLERVKLIGTASVRNSGRAVTKEDIETFALAFVASDGSRPVGRALAIEEGLGPKTVKLVVAGPGGGAVSQDHLDELGDYFNGAGSTPGIITLNHELTAINFTPHVIAVTAVVSGGNKIAIETALAALLSPVAKDEDGVTFTWEYGEDVPLSQINRVVMQTSPNPRDVVISLPAANETLTAEELPVVGTLTITVNP